MTRREFIPFAAAALAPPIGTVLVHEHVLVDFIGADQIHPGRYNRDEVFPLAKTKLDEVRKLGCTRLLECTPNHLGRDPILLKRLSDATGIDLWTNTGLYAAANRKFLPAFVRGETAEQLARRWITEARNGIDGIKPKFIKIGVNKAPLHELDRKIVQAAAICQKETGLTVASHTGDGPAALEQLQLLQPARFVWVHAQNEKDHAYHEQVAKAGAWVEFDGINERSGPWHKQCVEWMNEKGLLNRTLISQDSGWYRVGEPGGRFNGYTYIYTDFLPALDPNLVPQLMYDNPKAAFGA